MPAGMLTESVRSSVTRPAPEHSGQGSEMTSPRPWQVGQVRSIEKKPCAERTRPWPSQVGQTRGAEPRLAPVPEQVLQTILVGTSISAVLPAKASSSETSML